MNMNLKERRAACKAWLRNVRFTTEYKRMAEEYIAESEHQEGEEYWDQFQDFRELAEDFDAYCDAARDDADGEE